jgi:cytochrome c oxidase cbb3-type subunit 2
VGIALGSTFAAVLAVGAAERPAAETAAPAADTLEYRQWETTAPGEQADYNQRASLIQRGHRVYLEYCVGCHGEAGDGRGVAAERLLTKPRDFTRGIYKFRSTDSSSLPLESDLYRTITRGLSRVAMPAFPLMPHNEKVAVIEYVKTFYPRWEEQKGERVVVPLPRAPRDLGAGDRLLRGRIVFLEMQCSQCHGIDGRGKGATRTEYVDAWGHPQRAFDFTRGSLKAGNAPEDIYRTFHTGLRSIMPSYDGDTLALVTASALRDMRSLVGDAEFERLLPAATQFPESASEIHGASAEERARLVERNSWDLVAYILSLRREIRTTEAVLGAAP